MRQRHLIVEKTIRAPINIALIKYWGKKDEQMNLPLNDSISFTLAPIDPLRDTLYTETTVQIYYSTSESTAKDCNIQMSLNGIKCEPIPQRVQKCIRHLHEWWSPSFGIEVHINSTNGFPTASGLASSASGFAALSEAFGEAIKSQIDRNPFSLEQLRIRTLEASRMGSGSACRSMFGGCVLWSHSTGLPIQIHSEDWWPELGILVLVVDAAPKPISSTAGMQKLLQNASNTLLTERLARLENETIPAMRSALNERNFDLLGPLIMAESDELHGRLCQELTHPPIIYMNHQSRMIEAAVRQFNLQKGLCAAAYTFDAGPNAFIIVRNQILMEELTSFLSYIAINPLKIFQCKVGAGPVLIG